jgi:rhomboid protease GluP
VDRITTFEAFRKGRHGILRLGLRNRLPVALNTTMFPNIEEFDRLVTTLEQLLHGRVPKETLSPETPWLFCALFLILMAIHVSFYANDVSDEFGFLQWGALSRVLVMEGEYFRVLSVALIHAHWMHLLSNLLLLAATLAFMEQRLGRVQAGIVLFISAACASAMFLAFSSSIAAVGASGAIYGLLGVGVHRWFADPDTISVRHRSMPGWLLGGLVAMDLIIGAVHESIALSMHLGGFVSGFAMSWILLRYKVLERRRLQAALTAFILVCVTAAVGSVVVRNMDPNYSQSLARTFLTSPRGGVEHVRVGAWWIATLQNADGKSLALAESRLAEVTDEVGAPALDTLATLSYRQGRFDRAVRLEREVLEQNPEAFYASQLARFERAAGAPGVSHRLVHREDRVCVAGSDDTRFEIHAIQLQVDEIRSFIRARGVTNGTCFKRPSAILAGREIITSLVEPIEVQELEVDAWRMDPQVLSLP